MHLLGLEADAGLEDTVSKMVIQRGGHSTFTFLSLHCPTGTHLPLLGGNQPYCQKLTVITDSHTACSRAGHMANFQLGIWRALLVELFHGVYRWVRKVGERAEVSRVEVCSSRMGRAMAPFSFLHWCHLQLHGPCSVPALTVMCFLYVCFRRAGNAGLRSSSFLEVSKQHL